MHSINEISKVFTPRASKVNSAMYINRPDQERSLRIALSTGKNILIHGDSGCGKSWLYKKVFSDDAVYYRTLDMGTVINTDDLDLQILDLVQDENWATVSKKTVSEGNVSSGFLGAKHKSEVNLHKVEYSALLQLFQKMRYEAGKIKKCVLVLENLEFILDKEEVIQAIRNLLLSIDNEEFGKYGVLFCLVGVPYEIKKILAEGNKFQTISNRIYEVPELRRLARKSCDLLVRRGLVDELDYRIESINYIFGLVAFYTDSIPQYIHDLCLHIAFLAEENNNEVSPLVLHRAAQDWIRSNARQNLEAIDIWVDKYKEKRNAAALILYAISKTTNKKFTAKDINEQLHEFFSNAISNRSFQTLRILKILSASDDRILRSDDNIHFHVCTPLLRSALRIYLKYDALNQEVIVGL